MDKSNGGYAFPGFNYVSSNVHDGMTLRDYFAAKAMQGILSNPYWNEHAPFNPEDVAKAARDYADAMLKARGE